MSKVKTNVEIKPTKPKMNLSYDDVFGNPLKLSAAVEKELAEKALIGRWVNAKRVAEYQGYHPKGWEIFKSIKHGKLLAEGMRFGSDPEGVVRRGDCLLAVKSEEDVRTHRQFLQQKADRQLGKQKESANELRKELKKNNVDAKIHEGFEEN